MASRHRRQSLRYYQNQAKACAGIAVSDLINIQPNPDWYVLDGITFNQERAREYAARARFWLGLTQADQVYA